MRSFYSDHESTSTSIPVNAAREWKYLMLAMFSLNIGAIPNAFLPSEIVFLRFWRLYWQDSCRAWRHATERSLAYGRSRNVNNGGGLQTHSYQRELKDKQRFVYVRLPITAENWRATFYATFYSLIFFYMDTGTLKMKTILSVRSTLQILILTVNVLTESCTKIFIFSQRKILFQEEP